MAVGVGYYERRDDGTNGQIVRFRGDWRRRAGEVNNK